MQNKCRSPRDEQPGVGPLRAVAPHAEKKKRKKRLRPQRVSVATAAGPARAGTRRPRPSSLTGVRRFFFARPIRTGRKRAEMSPEWQPFRSQTSAPCLGVEQRPLPFVAGEMRWSAPGSKTSGTYGNHRLTAVPLPGLVLVTFRPRSPCGGTRWAGVAFAACATAGEHQAVGPHCRSYKCRRGWPAEGTRPTSHFFSPPGLGVRSRSARAGLATTSPRQSRPVPRCRTAWRGGT